MSIELGTQPGDRVRFVKPEAGYDYDIDAAKGLTLNDVYVVSRIIAYGFHTDVFLQEFPNVCFNSSHFDNV